MPGRLVRWALVLAFAAAVGHEAWNTLVGPPLAPIYIVGGEGPMLAAPDPSKKFLYLRRKLYVSERPRQAWLQVVGRDRFHIYANGREIAHQRRSGNPVGGVFDLTPFLRTGLNVLAITVQQDSVGYPPVVAIKGAYSVAERENRIEADDSWRCAPHFERGKGGWWFSPEFDDSGWPAARVVPGDLWTTVDIPPRATTEPAIGRWIAAPVLTEREVALRREVEIAGRPRQGWLRVTATASYLLAVNGMIVDGSEETMATRAAVTPVQRTYDITPFMRPGRNVVAFFLTAVDKVPHLLADLEVEDNAGHRSRLGTSAEWLSHGGLTPGWSAFDLEDAADWQPALAETGDIGVTPWAPARKVIPLAVPIEVTLVRAAGQVGLILAIALVTALACGLAARLLSRLRKLPCQSGSAPIAYLALVFPALGLGAAILATYDPRLARHELHHPLWLLLAVLSVPLQWALLAAVSTRPYLRLRSLPLGKAVAVILMIGLLSVGFWLRFRNIELEPLMYDEVTCYLVTKGFLERGYPSLQTRPDVPVGPQTAGELLFLSTGLTALFTDDPIYILRLPAVIFGTLIIGVIYLAGRRMFQSRAVGWLAAVFYTVSPVCIAMTNFGRYFEQTQFFALLTVYFYWLTVRGAGPLPARYVWLTVVCYLAMFLSWEPSGLIAAGMILAALWQRRRQPMTVLRSRAVWAGMVVILIVLVLQSANRTLMQTERIRSHLGLSSIVIAPIWTYPHFDPWFYVKESSWNPDTLIPLVGLIIAGLLCLQHPYRKPLRFLFTIVLTTCLIMTALLAITTFRYANHLIPLRILMASAAFVAVARALLRSARVAAAPAAWQRYAVGVGGLFVLVMFLVGSGLTFELPRMTSLHAHIFGMEVYKFPAMREPVQYVREHMQPGDVVIATHPHQITHLMERPDWSVDYYLVSVLGSALEMPDSAPVHVDSRSGAVTLIGQRDLDDLLARHRRIWYLAQPLVHNLVNPGSVTTCVRENMEVAYEDFDAIVLFRGDRHWTAAERYRAEQLLQAAEGTGGHRIRGVTPRGDEAGKTDPSGGQAPALTGAAALEPWDQRRRPD
jgi:hypothetical protein